SPTARLSRSPLPNHINLSCPRNPAPTQFWLNHLRPRTPPLPSPRYSGLALLNSQLAWQNQLILRALLANRSTSRLLRALTPRLARPRCATTIPNPTFPIKKGRHAEVSRERFR